jgi:hypothetical protein
LEREEDKDRDKESKIIGDYSKFTKRVAVKVLMKLIGLT